MYIYERGLFMQNLPKKKKNQECEKLQRIEYSKYKKKEYRINKALKTVH